MQNITNVAEIPSTINIAIIHTVAPAKAVLLLKYLNDGLKFGAEPTFNKKQAMLVTMNVIKNAIVINVAI